MIYGLPVPAGVAPTARSSDRIPRGHIQGVDVENLLTLAQLAQTRGEQKLTLDAELVRRLCEEFLALY